MEDRYLPVPLNFKIMILASHNTMTYLPPKKWWMKIFKSIYQCQNKTLAEQLEEGVRYFDIRISFDKFDNPEFRHGLINFKGNPYDVLSYLNKYGERIIVRVVLERIKDELDFITFRNFCSKIVKEYLNILFVCGEYKKTKEAIYPFNQYTGILGPSVVEMYGSVRGKGLERIFPKLYAKKYNERLINAYENDYRYLMLDFI